jgi:hypothetical protein
MRVLLSAFTCSPELGSEPRVGFQAMLAAARYHKVWVLTQLHMAQAPERFLQAIRCKTAFISGQSLRRRPLRADYMH